MARLTPAASAALALLWTVPATAAVTPEEVWQNWQDLLTGSGQTVTVGSEAREGDALVLRDIAIGLDDGSGLTVDAALDEMVFTDNGDGTVTVTMSDSYPITMVVPEEEEGEGPTTLAFTISQPGLRITAGGDADETKYDLDAPESTFRIDSIEGVDADALDLVAEVVVTGTQAGYVMSAAGDLTTLASTFSSTSAKVTVSGNDPESDEKVSFTASIADLAGTSNGAFLPAEQMEDMAAALKAGFRADTTFSYGQTSLDLDVSGGESPARVAGTMTGGNLSFTMAEGMLSYATGLTGVALAVSGAEIPFPQIDIGFAEMGFGLTMPLEQSDTPQPFGLLTKIVDFTISDEVWAMADPAGTFPRDPASFVVDVKGTANWTQDILSAGPDADFGGESPGEIHSLDLTQLLVRAIGAEVAGTGALTFDNTDLVTWDGLPTPTGTIDLTVKGANGLIDKAIAMGLLPEDEATGFRMMLAMFARPGAGPDELTSTLEFKDKGFYANGQQLR